MITIRDVAIRAGVSEATVSYVINNGPRHVTPETRTKILKAMEELDYHPNASARQLARHRTECFGVIFAGLGNTNFSSSYSFEYIRGITYSAESHGYNIMLLTNHQEVLDETYYKKIRISRLVDGLILIGSSIPDSIVLELFQQEFPAVLLARRIPGQETYSVYQDYCDGAYQATSHLLANGYRRIGFIGQAMQFSYARERLEGYRQALAEANLPYDPSLVSIPTSVRDDPTEDEIVRLLSASSDALITDRELVVLKILRDLGRRIPDDVALVGLDESETASYLDTPLTTMRPPKFDLGVAAVEMLLKLIAGEPSQPKEVVLPMRLILGTSSLFIRGE